MMPGRDTPVAAARPKHAATCYATLPGACPHVPGTSSSEGTRGSVRSCWGHRPCGSRDANVKTQGYARSLVRRRGVSLPCFPVALPKVPGAHPGVRPSPAQPLGCSQGSPDRLQKSHPPLPSFAGEAKLSQSARGSFPEDDAAVAPASISITRTQTFRGGGH